MISQQLEMAVAVNDKFSVKEIPFTNYLFFFIHHPSNHPSSNVKKISLCLKNKIRILRKFFDLLKRSIKASVT
jgi:hypothetical protein